MIEVAKYKQAQDEILNRLKRGHYAISMRIPSKYDMSDAFNVSRVTIRKALELLVRDGYLTSRQGSGYNVATLSPPSSTCLVSFTDKVLREGHGPGARLLRLENEAKDVPNPVSDMFGEPVSLVERLTGRVGCLLDMTAPDLTRDQILMWHGGGGPRYMLRGHLTWVNHPMIGRGTDAGPIFGAIADSRFAHGDCTILPIAGHGTAHFAVEGMVSEGPAEGVTGCRGWVGGFSARAGPCPAEDVVTTVLEHGIEHHLVLVQDRHRAAFEELGAWSAMVRLPVIQAHQDFAEGDAR